MIINNTSVELWKASEIKSLEMFDAELRLEQIDDNYIVPYLRGVKLDIEIYKNELNPWLIDVAYNVLGKSYEQQGIGYRGFLGRFVFNDNTVVKGIIYRMKDSRNEEVFYIGRSWAKNDLEKRRFNEHRNKAKKVQENIEMYKLNIDKINGKYVVTNIDGMNCYKVEDGIVNLYLNEKDGIPLIHLCRRGIKQCADVYLEMVYRGLDNIEFDILEEVEFEKYRITMLEDLYIYLYGYGKENSLLVNGTISERQYYDLNIDNEKGTEEERVQALKDLITRVKYDTTYNPYYSIYQEVLITQLYEEIEGIQEYEKEQEEEEEKELDDLLETIQKYKGSSKYNPKEVIAVMVILYVLYIVFKIFMSV